ncbi:MAG: HEAT repeat domain-containing protein [Bacteroidota bacterium]
MRLLSLLLLLALATPAFAQPATPAHTERLGQQLATLLADPIQRGNALDLALLVAEQYPTVDLTAAVDALVDVYSTDEDVRHRRAAAVALAAIGSPVGMEGLAERARFETDPRVRQATVTLLRDYVEALPAREARALDFAIVAAE